MEDLAASGDFSPPSLATLEAAAACGIALHRGRVFTDLWDLRRKPECASCHQERIERLHRMNLGQSICRQSPANIAEERPERDL